MDLSSMLRETSAGVELDLMVSPSSPRSEVVGVDEWRARLVVRLRSPPEKGEANHELESLLGRAFSAPVEVLRGHASRMKTVSIRATKSEVLRALQELLRAKEGGSSMSRTSK